MNDRQAHARRALPRCLRFAATSTAPPGRSQVQVLAPDSVSLQGAKDASPVPHDDPFLCPGRPQRTRVCAHRLEPACYVGSDAGAYVAVEEWQ